MSSASIGFSLDRGAASSLTEQVVDGLRSAIETGRLRPGDRLPSLKALSKSLGVSMIVTRAAIARLKAENLLGTRSGSGVTVLAAGERVWKGNVLVVTCGHSENYFYNRITNVVRERMLREGYLVSEVVVYESIGHEDGYSQLRSALRRPFDLVLSLSLDAEQEKLIRASGLPCVCLMRYNKRPPRGGAFHPVFNDWRPAVADLVADCRKAGIRRVLEVCCGLGFLDIIKPLRAVGIKADYWSVNPKAYRPGVIETVRERTMRLFELRLARGRKWLPDLLYFTDDYIATEALAALGRHGVRVPEDVRVVTLYNRGLGPVYPKSIARLELDADAFGEMVVGAALDVLSGRKTAREMSGGPAYVRGETFPVSRKHQMKGAR